jgi:hypothetical protein
MNKQELKQIIKEEIELSLKELNKGDKPYKVFKLTFEDGTTAYRSSEQNATPQAYKSKALSVANNHPTPAGVYKKIKTGMEFNVTLSGEFSDRDEAINYAKEMTKNDTDNMGRVRDVATFDKSGVKIKTYPFATDSNGRIFINQSFLQSNPNLNTAMASFLDKTPIPHPTNPKVLYISINSNEIERL